MQSCLSEGKGCHFPPCHILEICEFQLLFDCPLDLSALSIFSTVPIDVNNVQAGEASACACWDSSNAETSKSYRQKTEKPLEGSSLIHAVPWYKAVKSLKLWDASSIDVILISSPTGMLGLPFLTRVKGFTAQIYATEATTRLGRIMMNDLVTMHKEFRHFYGPEDPSRPEWMKWDEVESLPSPLRKILSGEDGRDLGGWTPLYSAADVIDCMQKMQSLKYAEEACYNGTLMIQALSSGLDIGTSNWRIISPKQNVSYISTSSFASATSQGFDYNALRGSDVIIFSDFTACNFMDEDDKNIDNSSCGDEYHLSLSDNDEKRMADFLLNKDDFSEESQKLAFLCSCSLDSVRAGGSVLIPIGRLSIALELLEQIAMLMKSLDVKVPIFVISSVAEELFAFLNVIPEWLCEERKDRLYSGQPLFDHLELLNEKRLFLFPTIHSPELLRTWQEPCVIFCPHWSLRLGPVVHLLRRWSNDVNSLLLMEEGVDTNLAFLPFKSMAIKVLQCSFLSGMKSRKAETLLRLLKPKYVLFPEKLKQNGGCNQLFQYIYYSEGKTLEVPDIKDSAAIDIGISLACRFDYIKLQDEDLSVARLKGELFMEKGKGRFLDTTNQVLSSQTRPWQYLGRLDLQLFLTALREKGMSLEVEEVVSVDSSEKINIVHVFEPGKALIEVTEGRSVISTADEKIASDICEVLGNMLDLF